MPKEKKNKEEQVQETGGLLEVLNKEDDIEEVPPVGEETTEEEPSAEPEEGAEEEEKVEAEPEEPPQQEEELVEIIHNGQVHKVTRDKLIELAQKGFDYDYKVGPHARLVELVESDPELQNLINQHVQKKLQGPTVPPETTSDSGTAPELKLIPFDQAEDPDEWLKKNFGVIKDIVKKEIEQEVKTQPAQSQSLDPATMLQMHDPVHFNEVMPYFWEALKQQPFARVQEIDRNLGELVKFYDEVRNDFINKTKPKESPQQQQKRTTPFRIKSNAAGPVREKKPVNVWELPRSKFEEILEKAKGF